MSSHHRVSSHHLHQGKRIALIKDTAAQLFNLDVHLGDLQPEAAAIDIQIFRGPLASVMEVNTSWSVVERSRARASAAPSGNLLVYLIKQGGSSFENSKGEQFTTHAGSVVIGSQDLAYKAAAAAGHNWHFQAISVPEQALSFASGRLKQGGFQPFPTHTPLGALLASYLGHFYQDMPKLDAPGAAAALRAFDHLLAGTLGYVDTRREDVQATLSGERLSQVRHYIETQLESASLSPQSIALAMNLSPRQLHRLFEQTDTSVAGEIRNLRLLRARFWLRSHPTMSITEVAFACGFDSLATFYRLFKLKFGVTASELRHKPSA